MKLAANPLDSVGARSFCAGIVLRIGYWDRNVRNG
jgi:hypothetical protein